MMKPLLLPDLTNILLNENAYFYKQKKKLSKNVIQKLFSEALSDKNATRKYKELIRASFFNGAVEVAKYSLDIFEYNTKPSFLEKPEPGKLETKYGLFLILEYKSYVAIIRKNVSGVKSLDDLIDNIDYNVLAYFLITNKSKFEKIVADNINTSENAIQTKYSEATDLKAVMSRFGASKQIINAIRLDNDGVKHSVSLNTSRVNSFQIKNKFDKALFWIIGMLDLIDRAFKSLPISPFIDGFATPINFEDIIDSLEPTYILLRFGAIKNEIEQGIIEKCYKIDINDHEMPFDLQTLINNNERLFELSKQSDDSYVNGDLKLKLNKHSITISNESFKEIILDYGNENTITLNRYLNYGNHFMVNFNRLDHVYSNRKIFKDSKLLGDLDNFFETFITFPEIASIKSEKGSSYDVNSVNFEKNSLFNFIEDKYINDAKCLICDDMGAEWGDFISIGKDSVTFIHAKFHTGGLSASDLEEVFGQAQKNFGSLELTDDMIAYRSTKWLTSYKMDKIQTKIKRIRKCPVSSNQINTIKELVYAASSSANFRRKVFVVINFISKTDLTNSIDLLKKGKTFTHKGVTLQILWFVNALLCNAYELNTEFRIICKP